MTASPLNLRHLRAFYEVGVIGQVSPVADIVFMSQPAISQAIAKFESRCGAPLFHRQSTGLVLTEAGKLMHIRVTRALKSFDDGAHLVTQRKSSGQRLSRQMTLTQLRALVSIADHGGFTKGAKAVGTSQPAISRAVRELESLCGRPLIEKTGRGVVLTHAAEIIAQSARLAFHEIRQGADEIKAHLGADTSVLTIGSLPLARSAIIPKAILAFTAANTDVAVHIIDGPYNDMRTGLMRGEIDLMIGALRGLSPTDDLVEVPLFTDKLSIIARAGHPLAQNDNISPEELQKYPWIVPRKGTPTRAYFDTLLHDDWGGDLPHLIESSSLILIRGLLVQSQRLTIISKQQVELDVENNVLTKLNYALPGSGRPIGLTYRRSWHPTKTQSRFLDNIRRAVRDLDLNEGA
ncbi:MAG: LysR family transcriptional regulator [Rhodobacteraceae bacterium]|nr:LysR family transcriptional regulator [Paracoccaceae bacterium]PHR55386.1 MAG: transcriptional regulator [Robiginitomaculum sp.]